MPLDTLANVKQMLGVTTSDDDDLLTALSHSAECFIAQHCGRDFCGGAFTETHSGGSRFLFVANYPIATVTSVKVDTARQFGVETVLDASAYVIHAKRGVIESVHGSFVPGCSGRTVRADDFPGTVQVAYTITTDDVPPAVCRAFAELVGHWYRQTKTSVSLDQVNMLIDSDTGTGLEKTYPWGQAGGFSIPAGVVELLRTYRGPSL